MAVRAASLLLYPPSPSLRRVIVLAFVVLTFALVVLALDARAVSADSLGTIDPFRWPH